MTNVQSLRNLAPPACRGVKELDRSAFTAKCKVWTVLFKEPKQIGLFLKNYKDNAMHIQRIPFLENLRKEEVPEEIASGITNKNIKGILLNDKLEVTKKDEESSGKDAKYTPELLTSAVSKECIDFITKSEGVYLLHELVLGYDFWKTEEILQAVLPDDLEDGIPTSFTKTGHIAHLNLKEGYKPYGNIIGQVVLDKNPSITTVVDKMDTIETKFRTFRMKVLAGEENFMVTQRESDCDFTFDFSKVYWNSRLSTEHRRLVDGFKPGSCICDVMAGVGPFAVPAGKRGCIAFANDLNPESYKYLQQNIVKNKVSQVVFPYNVDGAEFIKDSPKILMKFAAENSSIRITTHTNGHAKKRKVRELRVPHFFSDYAMNLPGSAITFVPNYVGLFAHAFPDKTKEEVKQLPDYQLPTIHVYHFEKFSYLEKPEPTDEELHRRIHKKIMGYLDYDIPFEELSFHTVRKVAPTKPMYCISFRLPEEVAFRK